MIKFIKKFLALAGFISFIIPSSMAFAAGSITVSPNSGLVNGQTITVAGSGLAKNSTGTIVECNNDPNQPNVTVAGNPVPVSCTNPLSTLISIDANGNLAPQSFVVHTGVIGPAASGSDSTGGSAAADAAKYPCPPTAAQIAAGDECVITVGDAAGDDISAVITFAAQSPAPAPAPSGHSTAPSSSAPPSSTTNNATGPSTLTNTGPGDVIALGLVSALIAAGLRYYYLLKQTAAH